MTTTYRTILADPPWWYNDRLPPTTYSTGRKLKKKRTRSAHDNYPCMTTEEICALGDTNACRETMDVAGHLIEDEAFLLLWTTNTHLLSGDSIKVAKAWGFEPKQLLTWIKGHTVIDREYDIDNGAGRNIAQLVLHMGMGNYLRNCTEQLIVATRGRNLREWWYDYGRRNILLADPYRNEHSRKPDSIYELIEWCCPKPYLELFARRKRDGWTSWGNELED